MTAPSRDQGRPLPWRHRPRRPLDLTQDVGFWFFALFAPAVVLICGITLLVVAGGQRVVGVVLVVLGLGGSALTAAYLRRPVPPPGDDG